MTDNHFRNVLSQGSLLLMVGLTTVFTTLAAPFSAKARSSVGAVGVKLVSAARVGFDPAQKLRVKRFGNWLKPVRSRTRTCFDLPKRKGVMKPTCVKMKLVEFQ